MNILQCSIENFGGLCQKTITFDQGLSVIEQENGSGKTTLAAFIRCMLYGMPRQHKRDLGKDLRRRYAPWQGGAYGGQLVVAVAQRVYRIERRFGTTPKEDTLAVYDQATGRRTDDLGAVPGITLFGLDADSFERSAYIPQNRLSDALATQNIKSKLGNLVDNTDGSRNFDTAMESLRKARSQLVPYRGQGGDHAALVANISRVSEEITQLSTAQGELERVRDREQRLQQTRKQQQAQLDQVRAAIANAADAQARRSLALECKRLDDARRQALEEYQACAATFNGEEKVPSEQEIQQVLEAKQCLDLVQRMGITQEAIDAHNRANAPEGAFAASGHGAPEGASAASVGDTSEGAAAASRDGASRTGASENADSAGNQSAGFAGNTQASASAEPASRIAGATGGIGAKNPQKGSLLSTVAFIVGALFLLGGVAFAAMDAIGHTSLFAGQLYAGAASALVGAVCCAIGFFSRAKRRKTCKEAFLQASSGVQAERSCDYTTGAHVAGAGAGAGGHVAGAGAGDHVAGAGVGVGGHAAGADNCAENDQNKSSSDAYISGTVNEESDFRDMPFCSAHSAELLEQACRASRIIEHFCDAHHADARRVSVESLTVLRDNVQVLQRLRQQLSAAEQALSQFVEVHGFCPWKRSDEEYFRSLHDQDFQAQEHELLAQREATLQDHVNDVQRMRTLQERVEKVSRLRDELDALCAQRKKMERDVDTLDATMNYLERAKEEQCENYAGPVQERFQYYFHMLVDRNKMLDAKKTQVDSDFRMTFSQTGATRQQENLSAGYADLVMVCMRMAVCDALYKKERPFIIMDDPFANVDDDMMQRAYELLELLSKDHQIIYFTCSNSRNPQAGCVRK